MAGANGNESYRPYLSRLRAEWLAEGVGEGYREFDGTLIFADISGFTPLTERLSRQGKVGAEVLTDALKRVFTALLDSVAAYGADCLKFGGDAMLLLFTGQGHAHRGIAAANAVRDALYTVRRTRIEGAVSLSQLDMSMGVHTGTVNAFLVGSTHYELVVTGPTVTRTLELEGQASAGEILLSAEAAGKIAANLCEPVADGAFRLVGSPRAPFRAAPPPHDTSATDGEGLCAILREHLLEASDDGEHRVGAVSFIKFGGVDDVIRIAGPAEAARRLNGLVSAAQEALARHGVTYLDTDVDKDGGKIFCTASAPVSGGDDEDRLLQAVSEVLSQPAELFVRAGVNRGRVFAVHMGAPYRRTYSVMGDAVNLTARVMGKAAWGQLLATKPVMEAARTEFKVSELEPFIVKGKSMPIEASVVHEAVGTRDLAASRQTRLVGREAELSIIDMAVESAFAGHGRLVSVVGPAGIGKSTLVDEALHRAEGMLTIRIAGGRYTMGTPYFALRGPMRAGLGLTPDAPHDVIEKSLRRIVSKHLPQLKELLPLVAAGVGIDLPETTRTRALNGTERHGEAVRAMSELIQVMTPGLTMFVVDDAHWLDRASADALQLLSSAIDQHPWVFLVNRRDEETGYLPAEASTHARIDLQPLADAAAMELAIQELAGAALTPGVLPRLVERANGNPLFLRELVAAAAAGSLGELPDTVEATIAARIDTLPAADRSLLRRASVLGRKFSTETLAGMLDRPVDSMRSDLDRLKHFLDSSSAGMVIFQHVLLREVAYEGLPFRTRRSLHERAGTVIERDAGPNADDLAELLSIHFHAARNFDKSWHYSVLAGDRSTRQGAPMEASAFFERAEIAGSEIGASRSSRADVAEALGDARVVAGNQESARDAFRRARRLSAPTSAGAVRAGGKVGRTYETLGDYPSAIRWYRRGLAELGTSEDPDGGLIAATLEYQWAASLWRQGRLTETEDHLRKAIELEAGLGAPVVVDAHRLLGTVQTRLCQFDKVDYLRTIKLAEDFGTTTQLAHALNMSATLLELTGEWSDSAAARERAAAIHTQNGNLVLRAYSVQNLGELHVMQGLTRRAEEILEECLRIFAGAHVVLQEAFCLGRLGCAYSARRSFEKADDFFDQSIAIMTRIGAREMEYECHEWRLDSFAFRGDVGAAKALADDVGAVLNSKSWPLRRIAFDRLSGVIAGLEGRWEEAIPRVTDALAHAREVGLVFQIALCLDVLAQIGEATGATDVAGHRSEANAIFDRLGVVWTPQYPLPGAATPQPAHA